MKRPMAFKKIVTLLLLLSPISIFCPDTPPRRGVPAPGAGFVTPPRPLVPPAHFVFHTPQGQVLTEEEIERRGPPPVTRPA